MFLQCINCNKSNISCLCRNMRFSASSLSSNNLVTVFSFAPLLSFLPFQTRISTVSAMVNGGFTSFLCYFPQSFCLDA